MGNPCKYYIRKHPYASAKTTPLVLPDDLLHEAIPGNIRKAEHFVAFLKRFVEYIKVRFPAKHFILIDHGDT